MEHTLSVTKLCDYMANAYPLLKRDLLITADIEQIKAAGYDVITPVIVCNVSDFPEMECHFGKAVKAMDEIITL